MPTTDTTAPRDDSGDAVADGSRTATDMLRLLRHSSVYAFGGMLNRVGAFLLLPIYTSYLSLAEYGTLELYYATAAVLSGVLSAGLAHATLRFYFEYEEPDDQNAVVSTNLVLGTALAIVGAGVAVAFRHQIASVVFGAPSASTGIAIMAATMVFELSTQICLAFVRAREESRRFFAIVLSRLVVQVGVNTYMVVFAGSGVEGVLLGNCLAVAFGWAIAASFTLRRCGVRVDLSKAQPILRYSMPFVGSTVVAVVAGNVDRFVIRTMVSYEALGLFALALKFSTLPEQLIGEPFNRAYGAFRFSVMRQDNAGEIQARVVRLLLALALFAVLGIHLFAADVLRLTSAEAFGGAAALLPPLLLVAVMRLLSYPMQTGILVQRETQYLFRINLARAVLYVGLSLVLVQSMGAFGVGLAMAASSTVNVLATGLISHRYFPVPYDWNRMARVGLVFVGAFLVSAPLSGLTGLGILVSKAAIIAAVPFALAGAGALNAEERSGVRRWIAGRLAHRGRNRTAADMGGA